MELFIKELLKEISEKYPEWDDTVLKAVSDDDSEGENKPVMRMFTDILKKILQAAKEENQEAAIEIITACFEPYKTKKFALRYIKQMLSKYHRLRPLRELERNDIYKAQCCVTHILERYVIRYDPYFDVKENGFFTEKEYKEIAMEMDRVVEICVEFNLYVSAIARRVQEETGLTPSFCDFIAKQIEASLDKLKLTYIICKLREN